MISCFGFGITLKPVSQDDLSLLCEMRNQLNILRFMDCRKRVTMPVLDFWLRKVERSKSTYPFIAYSHNIPVGYLEIKNCVPAENLCQDGIFLFDDNKLNQGLGRRIFLCREKILSELDLHTVISYIRPENKRSIAFFEKIGAVYSGTENGFLKFVQERDRRLKALYKIANSLGYRYEFEKEFPDWERAD